MKDFSKYEPEKKPADVGGDDLSGQFAKFASAYEGKSGDEMMAEILAEAEKGRRNGTYCTTWYVPLPIRGRVPSAMLAIRNSPSGRRVFILMPAKHSRGA